jgi:hypothetical protein
MKKFPSPKRTPFESQSTRSKRAKYIDVKNQIRRAAPILGGLFVTRHYMHGRNGWLDGYFLGRKAPIFYNLALQSTAYAYKAAVEERAWDESYEREAEQELSIFDRTMTDADGRRVTLPSEPLRYEALEGMTRMDWTDAHCKLIADSGQIQVHEEWSLHPEYGYGIGLHATIDAPVLTIDAVNAFVTRFLESPAPYCSPDGLTFRYDEIHHWGLESNAIMDPWDWASATAQSEPTDPDH